MAARCCATSAESRTIGESGCSASVQTLQRGEWQLWPWHIRRSTPTLWCASSASHHPAFRALDALVERGVLRSANSRRRNRIWLAEPVLRALDEFSARAGRRIPSDR